MLSVRYLGEQPYLMVWEQMKHFTLSRTEETSDEVWLLQHPPVYTQGQAGKEKHILNPDNIPVLQSDRGGQVTYHGPGQLVAYFLIDLRRSKMAIRTLVQQLEVLLLEVLADYGISGQTQCGAPGVYVAGEKIASIGLRVKNGCTYHGIALNVDMDLQPFSGINPCGYETLKMTQMKNINPDVSFDAVRETLIAFCINFLTLK